MKNPWNEARREWGDWGMGGPWARRGRFFEPGEIRLAILSLIAENPRHGYDVIKALEARSGGAYKVSAGTIYPTLQQLEDEGLITSEQNDGRRIYRITESGRAELQREAETVNEIWRRAAHWEDWGKWSGPDVYVLFGPLGHLAKSGFRAIKRTHGDRTVIDGIARILDRAREEVEELERRFQQSRV